MLIATRKKQFVNAGFFISFLLSWWMLASFVSQNAVHMNGERFESNLPVLGGLYYNDWLPAVATGVFGLSWLLVVKLSATSKSGIQELGRIAYLIIIIPSLGLVLYTRINALNYPTLEELFSTSLLVYMFGALNGIFISQLRKMEKAFRE